MGRHIGLIDKKSRVYFDLRKADHCRAFLIQMMPQTDPNLIEPHPIPIGMELKTIDKATDDEILVFISDLVKVLNINRGQPN